MPQVHATPQDSPVSWMHRFASLVAVMGFLWILTGTLVAGSNGAPAVAAWPVFLGGAGRAAGVKYAGAYHGVVAGVIALTLLLALWLWRSDSARYIKRLAAVTVGALAATAVIAALAARSSHAAGALLYSFGVQVFFSLAVSLALFTRTDWRWDHAKVPDLAAPSLRQVLVFMTAALYALALVGAGFRRGALGIAPHIVLGVVVTLSAVWVLEMAISKYPQLAPFKMAAIMLGELVALELFLGIVSFSLELEARAAPGRHPGVLVMSVTHAAVAALVLATSLFVTFQAFKYLVPRALAEPAEEPSLVRPEE